MMKKQVFVCTYNNQNAFETSKQKGVLGFSTENHGTIGSLKKISSGDLILLRNSREKDVLAFWALFEATDTISKVNTNSELIWAEEQESQKVLFIYRLPVKFIRTIPKIIPKEQVLTWKWKPRSDYSSNSEYTWRGYSKLFSGNLLDESQISVLFSFLEIDDVNENNTVLASDIDEPPDKVLTETYRILRDTSLAREIKKIYQYICQICNAEPFQIPSGGFYAEAHHVMPLGKKHNGRDVEENIICVCPTCHAKLDYGVIKLDVEKIQYNKKHKINNNFIEYHNNKIYNKA